MLGIGITERPLDATKASAPFCYYFSRLSAASLCVTHFDSCQGRGRSWGTKGSPTWTFPSLASLEQLSMADARSIHRLRIAAFLCAGMTLLLVFSQRTAPLTLPSFTRSPARPQVSSTPHETGKRPLTLHERAEKLDQKLIRMQHAAGYEHEAPAWNPRLYLMLLDDDPVDAFDTQRVYRQHSPAYRQEVITQQQGDKFIEQTFADVPEVVELWRTLPIRVLRSDLLRYLLVFAEGGVYAGARLAGTRLSESPKEKCTDIDTVPLASLESWLSSSQWETAHTVAGIETGAPSPSVSSSPPSSAQTPLIVGRRTGNRCASPDSTKSTAHAKDSSAGATSTVPSVWRNTSSPLAPSRLSFAAPSFSSSNAYTPSQPNKASPIYATSTLAIEISSRRQDLLPLPMRP